MPHTPHARPDRGAIGEMLAHFHHLAVTEHDAYDLTEWALRRFSALTGWPVAHAYVMDAQGSFTKWLSLPAAEPRFTVYLISADRIVMRRPTGLIGRTIATRRPAWVADLREELTYPRAASALQAGLRSVFALPVIRDDRIVAVLQFLGTDVIDPDDDLLDGAAALGLLLGTAYEEINADREGADAPSQMHRIRDAGRAGFATVDQDGRITDWSREMERLFGWQRHEALHRRAAALITDPDGTPPDTQPVPDGLDGPGQQVVTHETPLVRRDGSAFPARLTRWELTTRGRRSFFLSVRDLSFPTLPAMAPAGADGTDGSAGADSTDGSAGADSTDGSAGADGTAGSAGAADGLAARTDGGARPGTPALLLVDLRRIAQLESGPAHALADEALPRITDRLRRLLSPADGITRIGPHELAISLADADAAGGYPSGVAALAERMLDAIAEPLDVGGRRLSLTAHLGGALAANDDSRSLFGNADAALTRVLGSPHSALALHGSNRYGFTRWERHTPTDLERALARDEFALDYQPVVRLSDDRIVGAEALLRWRHPRYGTVAPDAFLDIAEESGMIVPIGEWMLREVGALQAALRRDHGVDDIRFGVNLSAHQLADPGIVGQVAAAMEIAGAPPVLELSEEVLTRDPRTTANRLDQLRALGVSVAIDDFGTGYSSWSYLKWFEVDVVKIDLSFVYGRRADEAHTAIMAGIVDLAAKLGGETVVASVDTVEQLAMVRAAGCGFAQGSLLGHPQPAAALTELLTAQRG